MGPLCTREDGKRPRFLRGETLRERYLDALLLQELDTGLSMLPSGPIAPEQGGYSPFSGMRASGSRGEDAWPACRATGIVRVRGRHGNRRSWLHTPDGGSHQPLVAVPRKTSFCQLGNGGS